MAKKITTVRELVARWGHAKAEAGAAVLAEDLHVKPGRVRQWCNRGRIPSEVWGDVVASAKARNIPDVTLPLLARLHARRAAVGAEAEPESAGAQA